MEGCVRMKCSFSLEDKFALGRERWFEETLVPIQWRRTLQEGCMVDSSQERGKILCQLSTWRCGSESLVLDVSLSVSLISVLWVFKVLWSLF